MLRLLPAEEADYFDTLIAKSANPEFAQTALWAKFKSVSWQPLHYLFEQGGSPWIAVTVWLRKIPLLPYYLAYAPRGPIMLQEGGRQFLGDFWEQLQANLKGKGAFALKIDPAWSDESLAEQLLELGFKAVQSTHSFGGIQPKATFRLDIGAEPEDLLASMPKKIRYNIRYPQKRGVIYRRGKIEDLTALMAVLQDTSKRKKFLGRESAYYRRLLEIMGENAALIIGYKDDRVVAASITIVCGKQAWAVYGGMIRAHSQLRAYYGLNWERMLWAKSKGASSFDFSGVPVDRSDGLFQFKQSFGGDFVEFIGEYELPIRPFLFWLWQTFGAGAMNIAKKLAGIRRHFS